jgi:hypothetical protein
VHHKETFNEVCAVNISYLSFTDLFSYKSVVYDDFIPFFTASKFNASAWVDLFDRAGAKYFVLVSVGVTFNVGSFHCSCD